MAAAAVAPVVVQGPPMMEVKNIFFKVYPPIDYFVDEAEADAVDNDAAFRYFNRSLECSNKHGCVILTFNNTFYLLRVSDILLMQNRQNQVTFRDVKKLEIRNDALPVTPSIISLSSGEEFLAVDTVRGDSAWVVIFKLSDFVNQGGSCRPFCEIRCSPSANSRISSICWNPGDGYNNLVALNIDDGSLFLAKIIGPNNVELNRFADGGVRCCCWSPKGKQLVIGRLNGNLSQLRLDLTEAKQIPGPEPNSIPVSILWTQTTQFLVVFHKDAFIDFMQLDVPKGAPPTYTNNGDIFISEAVPAKCSCFFVPLMQWNVVLAMSNSSSDVVVLVKHQQNSNELWIPGDITDNRRAAFLLDHLAKGSCVYYGSGNNVTFSEVESYSPMPMVFLLSQRGSLLVYSIVNSDPQAVPLNVNVSSPIPDAVFASSRPPAPVQSSVVPTSIQPTITSAPFFQAPQPQQSSPSIFSAPTAPPVQVRPQSQIVQSAPHAASLPMNKPLLSTAPTLPVDQAPQKTKAMFGLPQTVDPRQLGTSTLPTAQDMAGLQKAVEEKRREMTTQLQKGVSLKGLEDDDQCAFVISEVRKFEQRLADFKTIVNSSRGNLAGLVHTSLDTLEKRVLSTLNVVEDFSSDMVSTTSAQKEEVDVLKERILNHFSQLEYAKSLVERSRDPRYLEHLRSRPLDPASQQKFEEIKKLHNYLRNQVAECRRYFYEQTRKRDMPIGRVSYTQLIYLTLSNHSKIIRRLKVELDSIKERLGLGRHNSSYDEAEYLAVCEPSFTGAKKLDTAEYKNDPDEITLNDLTAGISKVKLNRDSDRPDKKPIKLANRKLFILKKCMPEVVVIKVKADEASWTRTPAKTASRPKPMVYPTTSSKGAAAVSRPVDAKPDGQNKPVLPSATFTIKSDTPLQASTPQRPTSNISTSFMGAPTYSPGIDISAMLKLPISEGIITANPSKLAGSPSASVAPKSAEISFVSIPKQSPSPSSILKTPVQVPAPNNNNTPPPSSQLPTLAGLLAAPIPTVSANLFSSSGLSFTNPSAGNTAKQDKGLNFGTGSFSFGTLQTSAASTKPTISSNVPPNVGTPSSLSINFGTSALPTTVSASPVTSSPLISSPATGIFGGAGPGGFLNKTPPVSAVSAVQAQGAGDGVPVITNVTTIPKTTNLPPTGIASPSSLTGALGKISSPGGISGGLFSSAPLANAAPGSGGLFGSPGNGSLVKTATTGNVTDPKGSPINVPNLTSNVESTSSGGASVTASSEATSSAASQPSSTLTSSTSTTSVGQISAPTTSSLSATAASTSIFGGGTKMAFGTFASVAPAESQTTGIFATIPTTVTSTSTNVPNVPSPTSTSVTTTEQSKVTASTPSAPVTSSSIFASTPTTATSVDASAAAPAAPGNLFSSTPTSAPTGLFSSTPAAPASAGVFSSTPASSAPSGLFSSVPVSSAPGGLFSSTPASTTPGGLFSSTPASTAPTGLFSSPSAAPSTTSAGPFVSSSSFFTPTTTNSALPGTGFMSSLSISDPSNKPATTTTTSTGGLFSTSTFGTAPTSAASIFGGSSTFGSQSTTQGQTVGSNSTTQTGFGAFGQSKPAAGVFGSPAATAAPVFGGTATFGGSSPFGSSFGGSSGASAFGSGSAGVFGSSATPTSQSTGFGTLAQQSTTTSAFGGSPFGGNTGQQQASVFGSPAQQTPAAGGGIFSSSFGSPAATSAGSVFGGGGGSVFGTATAGGGAFSSGTNAGGVAQQGFGFTQPKPSGGTAFGSPPAAAPVFGGGATFGSTSPFGSSFAPSPNSTFGSTTGGSVFGGGGTVPNAGFGTLAQQGSTSPGFGSPGAGAFGASPPQQQQQQQPSLFGSPQQQQAKPVFGGQAFSSWR